jgi:acetate kinase
VLIFTGGVGENADSLRRRTAERLGWLGVAIDPDRNASADSDLELSASGAAVRTVLVSAREDLQMVREIGALIDGSRGV